MWTDFYSVMKQSQKLKDLSEAVKHFFDMSFFVYRREGGASI